MVIRDDLTEALLQENLALKEKVKSLMKMLKKDRLKIKDLEAKIYENSVDMEIEKELNNTLEKGDKRKTQLEIKEESLVEEEVYVVDLEDSEQVGQQGEEESIEEETSQLKSEPFLELEQANLSDDPIPESAYQEAIEKKPGLLQSFIQEMRTVPSSPITDDGTDVLENEFLESEATAEEGLEGSQEGENSTSSTEEGDNMVPLEKTSEGHYKCNHCSVKHRSPVYVRNHIKGMHEGYKWKCDECGKEFSSPYTMNTHKTKRHNKAQATTSKKTSVKHRKGKPKISTRSIKLSLTNPKQLAEILNNSTNSASASTNRKSPSEKGICCKVCGKYISHKNNLYSHMRTHQKKMASSGCEANETNGNAKGSKGSISPGDAQEVLHQIKGLAEQHKKDRYQIEKNSDGKFQCNICSRSHPSEKYIKNHILGVHAGHKWGCNKCGDEFSSPLRLKSHNIKIHKTRKNSKDKEGLCESNPKAEKVTCKKCPQELHPNAVRRHMKTKHSVK